MSDFRHSVVFEQVPDPPRSADTPSTTTPERKRKRIHIVTGPKRLYSIPEAAHLLGIQQPTLRKWILFRRIGIVRLSARCIRIPHEEIDRLIDEAEHIPARTEVV